MLQSQQDSKFIINHIVTNLPGKIITHGVIPADEISDHDAPFIISNIRKKRCFKYTRDVRNFDFQTYVDDFAKLPHSIILTIR